MKKVCYLPYCAGVIDSDGCITIKRRKTTTGLTYAPVIFVRQVETGAVDLLKEVFGGPSIRIHPPSCKGGRSLNHWEISHRNAIAAAKRLAPYLLIKHRQAKILITFGEHMRNHRLRRTSHWFKLHDDDDFYTPQEAADLRGIDRDLIYQSITNKSVFAVRRGRNLLIPKRFWDAYEWKRGKQKLPIEYIALRENLMNEIRSLNGPTRGVTTASRGEH